MMAKVYPDVDSLVRARQDGVGRARCYRPARKRFGRWFPFDTFLDGWGDVSLKDMLIAHTLVFDGVLEGSDDPH